MQQLSVPSEASAPDWARLHHREIEPDQWRRFEAHMREIFTALGMDTANVATHETPARFLRALFDATEGYEGDPKLVTAFPTECREGPDCRINQVVEGPIPFYSLCEHHSLPFFGQAYVGYVAHENIMGISKLTRLVRLFARRFTVQERVGQEIADALVETLGAHGVAVYLSATHLCTHMRGVRDVVARTRTTVWRGVYADDPQLRADYFRLCEDRPA